MASNSIFLGHRSVANGIEITTLHNHMLDDQPHPFFMHFWADQNARELARGLRKALPLLD